MQFNLCQFHMCRPGVQSTAGLCKRSSQQGFFLSCSCIKSCKTCTRSCMRSCMKILHSQLRSLVVLTVCTKTLLKRKQITMMQEHVQSQSSRCSFCSRADLFFFFFWGGNCPPSARWQRYRTNLICARTAAQQQCVQAISPWQAIPNGASKTFFVFFVLGYRGIFHPLPRGKGTERR